MTRHQLQTLEYRLDGVLSSISRGMAELVKLDSMGLTSSSFERVLEVLAGQNAGATVMTISLLDNGLDDEACRQLLTALKSPQFCPSLLAINLQGNAGITSEGFAMLNEAVMIRPELQVCIITKCCCRCAKLCFGRKMDTVSNDTICQDMLYMPAIFKERAASCVNINPQCPVIACLQTTCDDFALPHCHAGLCYILCFYVLLVPTSQIMETREYKMPGYMWGLLLLASRPVTDPHASILITRSRLPVCASHCQQHHHATRATE